MSDSDDTTGQARRNLDDLAPAPSGSRERGERDQRYDQLDDQFDNVVNYGRLVNVLAATTDRLAEKGHTITETQTRIILQSLRDEKETSRDGAPEDPEDHTYRLSELAERVANVIGLDESFVATTVEDVVETRDHA